MVDTKLLGKPRGYSGNRSEWNQFKYVFKAYLGALSQPLLERVEAAVG